MQKQHTKNQGNPKIWNFWNKIHNFGSIVQCYNQVHAPSTTWMPPMHTTAIAAHQKSRKSKNLDFWNKIHNFGSIVQCYNQVHAPSTTWMPPMHTTAIAAHQKSRKVALSCVYVSIYFSHIYSECRVT